MTIMERTAVEQEMASARRRYAWLLLQTADALEAPCAWELIEETLSWHVVLRDAVDPDVDVEVLEQMLMVRATVANELRHALLPIPAAFDAAGAQIRFEGGVLEIRVCLRKGGRREV
jgi:hypothetical protein